MHQMLGKVVKVICCGRKITYTVGKDIGAKEIVESISIMEATPTKPFHALVRTARYNLEVYDIDECVHQNID